LTQSDPVATQPAPARHSAAQGSLAQHIDLFILLLIDADILFSPARITGNDLVSIFYLALFIHIGISLYVGIAGTARSVTWIALIGSLVLSQVAVFLGYVMPGGQISFWLASRLAELPVIGPDLWTLMWDHAGAAAGISALLGLILLNLDHIALHYPYWRRRPIWRFAVFVAAAAATSLVLRLALGWLVPAALVSPPDPAQLNPLVPVYPLGPAWHALPYYCILRVLPDKLGGVILSFAALLVPVIWPWARADILRTGPLRWLWRVCCLAGACVYIGLGYLGTLRPEEPWLSVARLLTMLYFGFFLLPFALHRIHRRRAAGPRMVAEKGFDHPG